MLTSARINPAKELLYRLFFPGPVLANGEVVIWTKVCGWVKDGKLTTGGRLFLTSEGRIFWRSARYEIPKAEWHTTVSDLLSVDLMQGSAGTSWLTRQFQFGPTSADLS